MTIRMTISEGRLSSAGYTTGAAVPDEATAEWRGQTYAARSAHGVTMALARKLVEAGCPNQGWEAFGVEGERRMSGPNLHSLACWTIAETGSGPKMVPYVAYAPSASTVENSTGSASPAAPAASSPAIRPQSLAREGYEAAWREKQRLR